ncbi:hypothetical protein M0R45_037664 [Rubus argutus]|uniref:DUF7804 domain-containing protein n=1 Tax=Rubus argutus TaxID=59490 RepID=A0AAW1W022_RUBAR
MASLGIGGNHSLSHVLDHRRRQGQTLCSPSSNQSARPCSRSVVVRTEPRGKIVNSLSKAVAGTRNMKPVGRGSRRRGGDGDRNGSEMAAAACEKLDGWMKDSVTEIVKNLREGPLLVHVYGNGTDKRRLETEKGVEEDNWDALKGKWEAGEAPSPEGVIFVGELMDNGEVDGDGDGDEDCGVSSVDGITRAYGLVVQGKGEECGPACYLLKTSRVNVGSGYGLGMGMGCTHFCLVRVKSFRESAQSQLKNSWLLQAQLQGQGR